MKKIMRDNGISMKRLTKYICGHAHGAEGLRDDNLTGNYCRGEFEATAIVDRLAAIEDILGDEYDLERLRELAEADREGRCVVPPCKVGQKVKVDVRTWGNVWNYKTVENGKFLIGEIVAITKTKKQTLVKIRVEHNVSWKRPTRRYPASAIGKTVFLTRAEAEAALRREQDEKGGEPE